MRSVAVAADPDFSYCKFSCHRCGKNGHALQYRQHFVAVIFLWMTAFLTQKRQKIAIFFATWTAVHLGRGKVFSSQETFRLRCFNSGFAWKGYRALPVAPVEYQVIHEPGIRQFHEFESPPVHTHVNPWGLSLVHKLIFAESARAWVSNTRWKFDEQCHCSTLCAIKIKGKNRRREGKIPVTTACPEVGKWMCVKKKNSSSSR